MIAWTLGAMRLRLRPDAWALYLRTHAAGKGRRLLPGMRSVHIRGGQPGSKAPRFAHRTRAPVKLGGVVASQRFSMWPPGVVEAVCKVLAATSWPGLTASEIGRLLAMRGFEDVAPGATKWQRLEAAMQTRQQRDRASNCLIRFITDAMEPSRYVNDPGRFTALRDSSLRPSP